VASMAEYETDGVEAPASKLGNGWRIDLSH
jgi:hypothetical protein